MVPLIPSPALFASGARTGLGRGAPLAPFLRIAPRGVFLVLVLLLGRASVHGETEPLPAPAATVLAFSGDRDSRVLVDDPDSTGIVRGARIVGGSLEEGEANQPTLWRLEAGLPFGEGRLAIDLNRDAILSDLALILEADLSPESDLTFQLFNGAGEGLAMDLFGEVHANASAVGTDTFVIPLSRYPEARRLVIRRLGGPVAVRGVALVPVLGAFEPTEAIDCVIRHFIRPHQKMMIDALRAIRPETTDADLKLHAESIIGQLLHYRTFRPFIERIGVADFDFPGEVVRVADHIAGSALRALGCEERLVETALHAVSVGEEPDPTTFNGSTER